MQQETEQQEEVRYWPVQVTLRRKRVSRGRWEADQWSLVGCESDRGSAQACLSVEQTPLADEGCEYRWRGLALELFRDERAAYRFNLSSGDPRLFVICSEDEGVMEPYLVTACQDDAASYMDGGEEDVFSISMPAAVQCWIEAFIARHGEPELAVGKSKRRHHARRREDAGVGADG
ncbi:DUF3305 domain-containing protein [Motiliproteus sp. SC1-56]|uniref:DUF3305 domain-containing protein n=1 Tax=Motiliproteus sp. SC1-56 TaxID=2799565 RepID=UPI001A90BFB4